MTARDDYPLALPADSYAGPMVERMHDEIDRLRAELAMWHDEMQPTTSEELRAKVVQRREDRRLLAIGEWVQANLRWHQFRPWSDPPYFDWAAPPCPTACGDCGLPEQLHPWATLQQGVFWAGYDHQLNTLLAAGDAEAER